jgi:PAP2 superfamily
MPGVAILTDKSPHPADRRFASYAMLTLCSALCLSALSLFWLSGANNDNFSPVLAGFMMVSLWCGLGIATIAHIFAMAKRRHWWLELRAPWLLIAILLSGTTLPVFELFKQRILPTRGFPLDPWLASVDRILFFGHDGWQVTHALFGSVGATMVLDQLYALWLPLMFAFPAVTVMAIQDIRQRVRILGTWLVSWILIAGLGAWIFASAGPCYYLALVGPDAGFQAFAATTQALAAAAKANGHVIVNFDLQALLLNGWRSGVGSNAAAGGISAMPSMHVAMASLFAMAGFTYARWLGGLMSLYAVLIWIGSVHLGWHYATDGIVGAAMMFGLWRASGRFVFGSGKTVPDGSLPNG